LILASLLFGLAAATLFSLFRNSHWPTELLTHFRPQMIAAGLALALVSAALGDWPATAVGAGLAGLNWSLMPTREWLRPDSSLSDKPGLTVIWANLWKKSLPFERTLQWAIQQRADLILLGECPGDGALDAALAPDYPHRLDAAPQGLTRNKTSRVVALSKFPLLDTQIIPAPGPHPRPFLAFGVDSPAGRINIYAVHPAAPMAGDLLRDRDAMIERLPAMTKAPFLMAGDFNATPWSPAFGRVPGKRVGSPFTQTWLSGIPLLGLVIDHIFISQELKPSAYVVGPALGSDHRALLARIHLVAAP
jgi:endonuclease/exonuclease/phosphatase (EEP) superfamily protein YafD